MTLPAVPETFYWTDSPCGLALKCRPLDDIANHLFTTRELQLSFDGAWERIAEALSLRQVAGLTQVHGRDVVSLRRDSPRVPGPCSGDALVSNDARVAVAVRAADCVPLLLADPRRGAVAFPLALDELAEPVGAGHIVVIDEGHELRTQLQRFPYRPVASEGYAGCRFLDKPQR
jgi:hypothetical protein